MNGNELKAEGERLMQELRVAEAAQSFRQATQVAPDDEGAFVRLGVAESVLGHRQPALAAFERALALNPDCVPAFYNRSGLKRYLPDDPELEHLARLLADRADLPLDERIMAHFTLGKAWLDVGEGDKAFPHFHQGNGLMRRTISFDVAASIAQMEQIPKVLTADRIAQLKTGGHPSVQPIFVIGMPRSGSTLIEQVLASHAQVSGGGELAAFRLVMDNLRQNDGQTIPYPFVASVLSPPLVGQIGAGYLHLTQRYLETGKTRLVDKLLENFLYAGLIHAALPQAKIVHCRRDAMDTCLSCYTMMFSGSQSFTFDMVELGRYWLAYDRLMAHWRDVLPPAQFIEIAYEDMVADLPGQTRIVLNRLDLPWDENCLSFHQNQRPVLTASSQQVRQPVHSASLGRWKPHSAHLQPLLQTLGIKL